MPGFASPSFGGHRSSARRLVARAAVACGVLAVAFGVRAAAAQLSSGWTDSAPRIERYATPEECLAAVWRMRQTLLEYGEVWRDTIPLTPAEAHEPLPESVLAAARRCSARFAVERLEVADYLPVAILYLLADRDADAEKLLRRRVAAIAPTADEERAAVLDTIVQALLLQDLRRPLRETNYLRVQPARIAMAEPYVRELVDIKAAPWQRRRDGYLSLLLAARDVEDSARMRWAAQGLIDLAKTIPPAEQRTTEYASYVQQSFEAQGLLAGDSLLDSLRRSTASYIALRRAHWAKASGERPEALQLPIGQRAPVVQGDFWFRRRDAATPRPTPGKVALVVFLDHMEGTSYPGTGCLTSGACFIASAALHRVAERFPDVEITLIARSRGHFSRSAPLEPAAEADTLAHWWLERHALPGALAVTATDFWRLPEPDRRRIDRDPPNELNYTFGRHWPVRPLSAYLIDRSGVIVDVVRLTDRNASEDLARLIDVLLNQPLASR